MKSSIIASFVILAVSCTNAPAPTAPDKSVPAPAAPSAEPAAAPAPAEQEKPLVLTEDLLKKFLALQKDKVALLRTQVDAWKKEQAKLGKDPKWHQSLAYVNRVGEIDKAIDEGNKSLCAKSGLTDREIKEIDNVVTEVSGARMLWKKSGGDQNLANMEKQMRAQLAQVPAAQRAEAEKNLGQMTQSMKDARDAKEARAKYGDATVDMVITHDTELGQLMEDQLKLGLGLH